MSIVALVAAAAAAQPVLHYVRSNSDGSEQERVVVFAESPDRVHVYKGRERCTRAAYVTARLDPATGQPTALTGGRLGRDLSQQPLAYFAIGEGRARVSLGSPAAEPVFNVAVGRPFVLYDFDLSDWVASPPREILKRQDFTRELLLLLTPPEAPPTLTNRGSLALTYAGRGTAASGDYLYYTAGGAALEGKSGGLWFDAGDGRLLAARLPLANHAEYRDFAYTLVKREDGADAWRGALADHWAGCSNPPA